MLGCDLPAGCPRSMTVASVAKVKTRNHHHRDHVEGYISYAVKVVGIRALLTSAS